MYGKMVVLIALFEGIFKEISPFISRENDFVMDFTGVIAKSTLFSLFFRKFLRISKLKKYPFSV
jgi:hypothetical protein